MTRPVDSVIEFLEAEQARGRSHVFLDEEARAGLRELFKRAKNPVAAGPTSAVAPAPAAASPAEAVISGTTKGEQLESLRKQAEQWAPAKSLGTLRDTMVFSTGNPDAEIMLVGEYPGYSEEKEGRPFAGVTGEKLDNILKAMGSDRSSVYLSNLLKFRPALPRQTTNNRNPSSEEIAACLPLLMAEIVVVQPRCIVAFGSVAAEGLLGLSGTIRTMRGEWHEVTGIPARATFHPSTLLRTESTDIKRELWEDMLAVMEKLAMPISAKQRGFFLPKGGTR